MQVFDTLTKKTHEFVPLNKDHVNFYHCGPTVYWTQQIGNMFAMVMADLVYRTLVYNRYNVSMARNYTDVGHLTGDNEGDADAGIDRMEKAAKRDKKTPEAIAAYYIEEFDKHTALLNIITPTFTPKATDHIADMIDLVEILIEKGFAYQTDLAIYFDISKKEDYTKLSGQDLSEQRSGAGHGDVADPDKRDPRDFSVWFFKAGQHANALQTWDNPFSDKQGFPGWHVECSAMINTLLVDSIDLHMGGIEHIPVHHTNEIAQSESAYGTPFVQYWLHNEHLLVDGHKMGKSAGNAFTVDDIIKKGFDPLDLRYFFLQAHYRSKQNFTWEALEASRAARKKLTSKIAQLSDGGTLDENAVKEFRSRISQDFSIPQGLAYVYNVLSSDLSDADKKATILNFDAVLGLDLDKKSETMVIPDKVLEIAEKRLLARASKDWALSDTLRDQILDLGYIIKDTSDGYSFEQK